MKKKILLLCAFLVFVATVTGCKDDSNEPFDISKSIKGTEWKWIYGSAKDTLMSVLFVQENIRFITDTTVKYLVSERMFYYTYDGVNVNVFCSDDDGIFDAGLMDESRKTITFESDLVVVVYERILE